jgi:transcriptional regulator with XRE-family HTH domain
MLRNDVPEPQELTLDEYNRMISAMIDGIEAEGSDWVPKELPDTKVTDDEAIRENVRRVLNAAIVKQFPSLMPSEIARGAGVSDSTFSNIRNGRSVAKITEPFRKICKYVGIDPSDALKGKLTLIKESESEDDIESLAKRFKSHPRKRDMIKIMKAFLEE